MAIDGPQGFVTGACRLDQRFAVALEGVLDESRDVLLVFDDQDPRCPRAVARGRDGGSFEHAVKRYNGRVAGMWRDG